MPLYDFKNKDTGEVFEKMMSIAAKEEYLKENPNIESVLGMNALIDPVRLGLHRPDQGFKEVLQRIDEKTAGSKLKETSSYFQENIMNPRKGRPLTQQEKNRRNHTRDANLRSGKTKPRKKK